MSANRATALREFDRQDEAMQTAREALLLAEESGTPRLATARFSLSDQFFCVGQWDDAPGRTRARGRPARRLGSDNTVSQGAAVSRCEGAVQPRKSRLS